MSVQAYLRAVVADDKQLLATGAFDVFIAPDTDHPHLNYAIPRDGVAPDAEAVGELIGIMQGAGRMPRLEFLPATAPEAERALADAGFEEELRTPVMTATPDDLADLDVPERVTIDHVGPDAEGEVLHALQRTRSEAFGSPYDPSGIEAFVAGLPRRITVVAYADGEVAGGGSCQLILGGTTELVGIAVAERFRSRGIGAAITRDLASRAFEAGATTVFLTPGDESALRIYARAGFEATDEMLHLRCQA